MGINKNWDFWDWVNSLGYEKVLYGKDFEIKTLPVSQLKSKYNLRSKNSIKYKMLRENNWDSLIYNGMGEKYFDDLQYSLTTHGYDPEKFDYIEVNSSDWIVDGNVRTHLLLIANGDRFELKVKVLKKKPKEFIKRYYWSYFILCILIFMFFIYLIIN
jgi:hypothetical protein|tara:strand:- start:4770 stop:5243 length:474 start_codon:yes stop_codon:yes gene_type:complete